MKHNCSTEKEETLDPDSQEVVPTLSTDTVITQDYSLLVFDIDDTLVKFILDPQKAEDADIQLNFNAAGKGTKEIKQSCNLIPGILELLEYIVLEKKLRIDFFRAARSTRNELLIPIILEKAFPYNFTIKLRIFSDEICEMLINTSNSVILTIFSTMELGTYLEMQLWIKSLKNL
jgi:hypothetical protein